MNMREAGTGALLLVLVGCQSAPLPVPPPEPEVDVVSVDVQTRTVVVRSVDRCIVVKPASIWSGEEETLCSEAGTDAVPHHAATQAALESCHKINASAVPPRFLKSRWTVVGHIRGLPIRRREYDFRCD